MTDQSFTFKTRKNCILLTLLRFGQLTETFMGRFKGWFKIIEFVIQQIFLRAEAAKTASFCNRTEWHRWINT